MTVKEILQKLGIIAPKNRKAAQRMLTLHRAEVYYFPMTKCGSTYLKNLFYYLDHKVEHPAGKAIHSKTDEDLVRAKPGDDDVISQSPYAFAVLRDPVGRLVSLYFDKIYGHGPNKLGTGPKNFGEVRRYLISEVGLDLNHGLDADAHRQNLNLFIDWLDLNLSHKTDYEVNSHWRKQSTRLKRVKDLNLQHLTLEGISWQLPMLLGEVIPDISEAMAAVRADNRASKPFTTADIIDADLREKIEKLYSADKKNYEAARDKWQLRIE
ncbi:MAG: sulfotransferase family 2 domain-containing protein [Alphaproteobacteria bacterium]